MQPRSSRILNNHQYTKEELIKNNNITSAIFLLDQKVEPLEFLDRLKAVALEFNKLTDTQKMILKHWIRNTVDETIALKTGLTIDQVSELRRANEPKASN